QPSAKFLSPALGGQPERAQRRWGLAANDGGVVGRVLVVETDSVEQHLIAVAAEALAALLEVVALRRQLHRQLLAGGLLLQVPPTPLAPLRNSAAQVRVGRVCVGVKGSQGLVVVLLRLKVLLSGLVRLTLSPPFMNQAVPVQPLSHGGRLLLLVHAV